MSPVLVARRTEAALCAVSREPRAALPIDPVPSESKKPVETKMQRLTLAIVLLTLVLTTPTWGQEANSPSDEDGGLPEGVFVEAVDVDVVNVEVFVTDRDGNRITGLEKDDFELEVGKKIVPITNFYAVEGGRARSTPGRETVEPIADDEAPRQPLEPIRLPEDQKLHLILYVDNLNLHPFTRNRVLANVRQFLRSRLRPGDEVMLATYERSLHIRHPFTSDPELIASMLFEIEEMSGMAVHFDSDRRDMLDQIYEAEDQYQVRGRATQYAESIYSDMNFAIDALKDLVDTLAGLPGRKAILHISDGLSFRAGEDIFYAINDQFPDVGGILLDAQRYDLSRRFTALTNQANANRVTFYTIEAAGLRTYSYMDASNPNPNGGPRIDQIHFNNLQSSLRFMADETGGMAMVNSNNYAPMLERMADDFDTYYSLGFTPAPTERGRYFDIRVRVKGLDKGVRVRHREGYRSKPVTSRMADGTLAALHYGYERNPLGVKLEFGERIPQENGHYLVSLKIQIPIGALSFLPQNDIQRGKIRLWVGAMDEEGGIAPIQDVPVPIDIPSAQYQDARGKFYQYEMKLLMRNGRQVVAVGVRDEIGATSGFLARGVDV